MRIFFKHGDGLALLDVENPTGNYLIWTLALQEKFESYLKPYFNEDYTDIIESATEKEVNLYNQEQIQILNENQYNELQPYDWYFTRFIRKGIEVPKEIVDITNEIDERYKKLKEKYK